MENLPKIIKDERGQLRILVFDPVLLNDSELTVVQNVGMKGKAIVTCTFEADLSEYKTEDSKYLKKRIEDLSELIDIRKKYIDHLEDEARKSEQIYKSAIFWEKEYNREKNKTWYQKLFSI